MLIDYKVRYIIYFKNESYMKFRMIESNNIDAILQKLLIDYVSDKIILRKNYRM